MTNHGLTSTMPLMKNTPTDPVPLLQDLIRCNTSINELLRD